MVKKHEKMAIFRLFSALKILKMLKNRDKSIDKQIDYIKADPIKNYLNILNLIIYLRIFLSMTKLLFSACSRMR